MSLKKALFQDDDIETADLLAGTTFYAFIVINDVGFFSFPADSSSGTYPGGRKELTKKTVSNYFVDSLQSRNVGF
ncbi:hypothetical protein [Caldanaerovirga acetigignens]|uniref:hypothetical protein n=1 Tax=Caldanaerovirga acetigignens TaxID=447595 RepID=UPI003CC80B33